MMPLTTQFNAVIAPMLIAAVGIVLSILGIFLVRTKEGASQKELACFTWTWCKCQFILHCRFCISDSLGT